MAPIPPPLIPPREGEGDAGYGARFLQSQLLPEKLAAVCERAGQKLTLRMQDGYDHSYYFISTFMDEHLRWHGAFEAYPCGLLGTLAPSNGHGIEAGPYE